MFYVFYVVYSICFCAAIIEGQNMGERGMHLRFFECFICFENYYMCIWVIDMKTHKIGKLDSGDTVHMLFLLFSLCGIMRRERERERVVSHRIGRFLRVIFLFQKSERDFFFFLL